jgi:hypothetical protein
MSADIDAQIKEQEDLAMDKEIQAQESIANARNPDTNAPQPLWKKILSAIGQGMNVGPGVARTAMVDYGGPISLGFGSGLTPSAASVQQTIEGVPPTPTPKKSNAQKYSDMMDAWAGKAPPLAPGVEGFAEDMAMDPTMALLSGGGKLLGKTGQAIVDASRLSPEAAQAMPEAIDQGPSLLARIGKALSGLNGENSASPIASSMDATGKKLYKSGFSDLDAAATSPSVPDPSDVLYQNGVSGATDRSVGKKVAQVLENLNGTAQDIASKASATAPPVSQAAAMGPVRTAMAKFSRSAVDVPAVNRFEPIASAYEEGQPVNVNDALYLARRLRAAGREAYGVGGSGAGVTSQLSQAGARGFMDGVGDSIGSVDPDAADLFGDVSRQQGSLIAAQPTADAASRGGSALIDPIDASILAGGKMSGYMRPAGNFVLLKKAIEAIPGRGGQTYGGSALRGVATNPLTGSLLDPAARQAYIQAASPWNLMPTDNGQNQ